MMNTKKIYGSFDYVLAILVSLVAIFGVILVGSSTGLGEGKISSDFTAQIVWVVTGILIMLAAAFIDYQFICKFYIPIYIINIGLLIAVLIFGHVMHYTTYRWIGLGIVGILPSEFSKVFMIIFLASVMDRLGDKISKFHFFLMAVGLTLVPFGLILIEPSLSASLVTLVICVAMLFAAKLRYRYFVIGIIILAALSALIYYDINAEDPIILDKLLDYQTTRIETFFYPDPGSNEYYQAQQSIRAIGSGQLSGKGLFNNDVMVPYSQNDFIFSTLGAEFGFVGSVATLGVMFIIVIKCLLTAWRSEIQLGRLIAVGCFAMLAFQVFVNVGVSSGMLPVTGMTFPFLSSGGSSVWVSFACIGLVINVGMTKPKKIFEI
jgi:rod shape determining protein RodA